MQITISGSISTGSNLPKFIDEKLTRVTNKYFSTAVNGNVHFAKQRENIYTVITINEGSKRGIEIKSDGESQDIYSSFEIALGKIAKQLKKYKERLKKYRREAVKNKISENLLAQNYYIADVDEDYIDEDFMDDYIEDERERKNGGAKRSGLNIIAEKEISIEILTVREAIMKMDLTDRPVLIFKNKDNGRVNVVYRRKDGNVSWVDAKQ